MTPLSTSFLNSAVQKLIRFSPSSSLGIGVILGVSLLCSGCDQTKRALGLKRSTPDEFEVLERAPLSTPPGLALTPPQPGVGRPQETPPQVEAQETLLGTSNKHQRHRSGNSQKDGFPAGSEAYLIQTTTSKESPPKDIRQVVDQEAKVAHPSNEFVEKLLYWQKKEEGGDVVDPRAEHRRLYGKKHPTEQSSGSSDNSSKKLASPTPKPTSSNTPESVSVTQ